MEEVTGLNRDALLMVFSFLPVQDLCRSVVLVCKRWNDVAKDELLWQYYCDHLKHKLQGTKSNIPTLRMIINGLQRTEPELEDWNLKKQKLNGKKEEYLKLYRKHILCMQYFDRIEYVPPVDPEEVRAMKRFEDKNNVRIPDSLFHFFKHSCMSPIVCNTYPTNNLLILPKNWELLHCPDDCVLLRFLDENQGCCFWYVKWDPRVEAVDPPVLVTPDWINLKNDPQSLQNASLGLDNQHFSDFFNLYAKDGLEWYTEHPQYKVDFKKLKAEDSF